MTRNIFSRVPLTSLWTAVGLSTIMATGVMAAELDVVAQLHAFKEGT